MLHGILVGASEWALFTRIDASIAEAFREAGCGQAGRPDDGAGAVGGGHGDGGDRIDGAFHEQRGVRIAPTGGQSPTRRRRSSTVVRPPWRPPASKYPANLRQLVRQGRPAPCAGACRTDKLPFPAHRSRKRGTRRPPTRPSSFPRSQGSHRPPGDWTASIAQGLRDLGMSRAVFPDSESGSLCPYLSAGRFRPRFALSQSRGLKPKGIQPDESSEETEAVWENVLRRGRNNSRNQLRTNAKYNTVHATCRGGAVNETSSLT